MEPPNPTRLRNCAEMHDLDWRWKVWLETPEWKAKVQLGSGSPIFAATHVSAQAALERATDHAVSYFQDQQKESQPINLRSALMEGK